MAVAGRHLHGGRARRGRLPVRYPAVCHGRIYSTRRPAIFRPTGLSGPAPHLGCCRGRRHGISQLRRLLALGDSTRATQTPRCGGSRTGAVCHRRAPHFDRLGVQPSGAADRISPRRSPNPASVDALLSDVNVVTSSAQSTSTAPAAVSASWPCALERRSRGASSWPHTARGFGALSL